MIKYIYILIYLFFFRCCSDTQAVQWFWEVVSEYNEEMKKKLMIFVTGSDRICPTGIEVCKIFIYNYYLKIKLIINIIYLFIY